jgi:acetyl esterase/lipase
MHVGHATPPTLLINGLRDELVSPFHGEFLSDRLLRARVAHLYLRLPWAVHGCDYIFRGPCGQMTTYAVERFLDAVLK